MKKKITSIVLIFLLTLMFTVDLYNQESYAVAPVVLVPAALYGITLTIAAAGIIGSTSADQSFIVNDYISKISDYEKRQWNQIASFGLAVGSLVVDGVLSNSITNHLLNKYETGSNVTTDSLSFTTTAVEGIPRSIRASTITIGNVTISDPRRVGNNLVYYENGVKKTIGFAWGNYVPNEICLVSSYTNVAWISVAISNDGVQWMQQVLTGGIVISPNSHITCDYSELYNYTGDVHGIGQALSDFGALTISLPNQSSLQKELGQIEADQALVDYFEQEMNKVNKTNKPNWGGPGGGAAVIAAVAASSYYWLDPVTKKITQTTTQTPPPGEDLIPVPQPGTQTIPMAPSLPENYPTEDNPEIKTEIKDPIITFAPNPDLGTTTETKVQDTVRTERYYDPEKGKWIDRSTTTRTTTTTDIDDLTGDRTETGRTTITLPDGTTTETPPLMDSTDINWEPLKQLMYSLMHKFPFSLPWDIYNSYSQFESDEWDGKILIDASSVRTNYPVKFNINLDLSMFDDIRVVIKQIELVIFDIGLILVTRKLMGGGV